MRDTPVTRLLATRESIEAVAYARRMIERGHRDDDGSFFGPERSREFLRNAIRMMMLTPDGRIDLIEYAEAGEEDAQAVVRNIIFEFESRHEPVPKEFEGYKMKLIAGREPPRLTGDGPDRRNTLLRDIAIAATVAAVCDRYGLKPTGRPTHGRSGCAIVVEALGNIRIGVTPKAVGKIWQRYRRSMPTAGGWSPSLADLPSY